MAAQAASIRPILQHVPSTIIKTRRRKSPFLRLTLNPNTVSSSYRSNRPVDVPPTPSTPVSPIFATLPDIPPTPRTPLSPIFAALSEFEEPRGGWPQIELQRAAMEDALNRTRHLLINSQRLRTEEKYAPSRGSFGEVWRYWLAGMTAREERVAVKIIRLRPKDGLSNRRLLRHLLREVVSWYELDHPNITPFVGYTFDKRSARMVSRWQEEGNISEYMLRNPVDIDVLCLAAHVACGPAYLHGRNPPIVHGDIKPENILIGADGIERLADFALSTILDDTLSPGLRTSNGCRYTLLYADPVLLHGVLRTTLTDLWALGWIICELGTSRKPYDKHTTEVAIKLAVVTYQLPTQNSHDLPYPELLWPILEACWSKEFSCRWSAEKISSHLMDAV